MKEKNNWTSIYLFETFYQSSTNIHYKRLKIVQKFFIFNGCLKVRLECSQTSLKVSFDDYICCLQMIFNIDEIKIGWLHAQNRATQVV